MAMQYYICSTEQIISEGKLVEYGGKEKKGTDKNEALTAYYQKLSNVSAALGKTHTYMNIQIVNSVNGEIKSDVIGEYLLELPTSSNSEEG